MIRAIKGNQIVIALTDEEMKLFQSGHPMEISLPKIESENSSILLFAQSSLLQPVIQPIKETIKFE